MSFHTGSSFAVPAQPKPGPRMVTLLPDVARETLKALRRHPLDLHATAAADYLEVRILAYERGEP